MCALLYNASRALDTKTCRCEECQKNRDILLNRESSRKRMKIYREKC